MKNQGIPLLQFHFCLLTTPPPTHPPTQAAELHIYESAMMLFEHLGLPQSASRFGMAAAGQVGATAPGMATAAGAVIARRGRLWANVFEHAMQAGEFEARATALSSLFSLLSLSFTFFRHCTLLLFLKDFFLLLL
jgi:hypothetical protein